MPESSDARVVVDGLLQLTTRRRRREVEIDVRGEIHPDNVRVLSAELNDALEGNAGAVLVDLGRLEFLDSVGVAALAAALERDFASKLRFVFDWSDDVDQVLELSGLLPAMRRGCDRSARLTSAVGSGAEWVAQ